MTEGNGDRDYGLLMAAMSRMEQKVDRTIADVELVRGEVRALNEAIAVQVREDQRLREQADRQWDEISKVSDRQRELEEAATAGAIAGSRSGAKAAHRPALYAGGGVASLVSAVAYALATWPDWGPRLIAAIR